jgi:hypothetical protein
MKFKVLQRHFNGTPKQQFEIIDFEAENEEKAYEIIDEEISTNRSGEWLMTTKEYEELKKVIK